MDFYDFDIEELVESINKSINERYKRIMNDDSTDETLKDYMRKYESYIKSYLDGFYFDKTIYYNDPEGPNSILHPYPNPIRKIDLTEVDAYYESHDESDHKEWEDFIKDVDTNAGKFKVIYDDKAFSTPLYLIYKRINKEICLYDLRRKQIVVTDLMFDICFDFKEDDAEFFPEEVVERIREKGECTIIYNIHNKRYGLLLGSGDFYDVPFLKSYKLFKDEFKESGYSEVYDLVRDHNSNLINDADFIKKGFKLSKVMRSYIYDCVFSDDKIPDRLLHEIIDDHSTLMSYVEETTEKLIEQNEE